MPRPANPGQAGATGLGSAKSR